MRVQPASLPSGSYNILFQAEDGIRDKLVTGVQPCALPIWRRCGRIAPSSATPCRWPGVGWIALPSRRCVTSWGSNPTRCDCSLRNDRTMSPNRSGLRYDGCDVRRGGGVPPAARRELGFDSPVALELVLPDGTKLHTAGRVLQVFSGYGIAVSVDA